MRTRSGFGGSPASIAILLFCMTILSGCGGSGSGQGTSPPPTLSSAEITTLAAQANSALIANSVLTSSELCYNPYLTVFQEQYCAIPIATSVACPSGGISSLTGSVSGDFSGVTVTGTGTGTLDLALESCVLPGTTETLTTAAPLLVDGSWFYFYTGLNSITTTTTGAISYGPEPAGACPISLTLSATIMGNSAHTLTTCTVSGTACGQTIPSTSCMPASD
jgi:hypothetical protein